MGTSTALFAQKQPGGVFDIQDLEKHPNDVWFVCSTTGTDGVGYGHNPDAPTATLDYAIGLCTASKGDVIYVLPGHAETIAATNGFDADVAGIKIVGLGWGANRPTFTFSATASQVNVGAASVWLENLRFIAGVSAGVAGVQVEGFTDFVCKNCEWDYSGTSGHDFVISLELEAGCTRALIENCVFRSEQATAGPASFISLTGVSNDVTIQRCQFLGDMSTAGVVTTDACLRLIYASNLVYIENWMLYESQGQVVSRPDLVSFVWGDEQAAGVSDQALDALIRRLRDRLAALDPTHQYISTVRGHGVRLDNPSA